MNGHLLSVFSLASAALVAASGPVSAQPAARPDRQALIAELVLANRILANEGVLDGYGHVSVRSPTSRSHYFLSRSKAPALVTAADITEYDLDSRPVSNTQVAGYIERFIHGEIYRARQDVMAVVHCHCPHLIPFAATSVPLRPPYTMGGVIGGRAPLFDIRKAPGTTDMLVRAPQPRPSP